MMTYEQQYDVYLNEIQAALQAACDTYLPEESRVCQAARYSLLAGGKRIRAVLTMACCDMLGGDWRAAAHFAAAVEMLHCFSLIHDDLPCMDNSDLRRGRPANHIQYGEDIALLAGDGLLTLAFETALSPESIKLAGAQRGAEAARLLAKAAGAEGMVGGQVIDLQHENQRAPIEVLLEMDRKKTGALIQAAAQMGCAVAGADQKQREAAVEYAACVGLAFQIRDDILDVISDPETLGKPVGSDDKNEKSTYVSLLGMEKAQQLVNELTQQAESALSAFSEDTAFLREFAQSLANRGY